MTVSFVIVNAGHTLDHDLPYLGDDSEITCQNEQQYHAH